MFCNIIPIKPCSFLYSINVLGFVYNKYKILIVDTYININNIMLYSSIFYIKVNFDIFLYVLYFWIFNDRTGYVYCVIIQNF